MMMSIRSRLQGIVLLPVVLVVTMVAAHCKRAIANPHSAAGVEFCLLCGSEGVSGLKRPHFFVNSRGKTCNDLCLELALTVDPLSDTCDDAIDDFGEMCCGDEEPDTIEQAPTRAPDYSGQMGDYPVCPICWDETYPSNEAMVINILGIGADSCRMYYHYGLRGLIRTELCDTLQSFAYEPCGCGKSNSPPTPSAPAPTPAGGNPPTGNGGNGDNNGGGLPGGGCGDRRRPLKTILSWFSSFWD